jgi:peroxiredoxin
MQCRVHSAQLGRQYSDLKAAHTQVLIILGDPVESAKKYSESLHLPFPVLADPQRQVYHRYGLQKALILIQRTASVVVDKDGIIRYLRTVTNPMTWLEEHKGLIAAVQEIDRSYQTRAVSSGS